MTTPSTKVTAATLAAAVTAIAVWQLEMHVWDDIPAVVRDALVVILTLAAGYVVPERNPAPSAVDAVEKRQNLINRVRGN